MGVTLGNDEAVTRVNVHRRFPLHAVLPRSLFNFSPIQGAAAFDDRVIFVAVGVKVASDPLRDSGHMRAIIFISVYDGMADLHDGIRLGGRQRPLPLGPGNSKSVSV